MSGYFLNYHRSSKSLLSLKVMFPLNSLWRVFFLPKRRFNFMLWKIKWKGIWVIKTEFWNITIFTDFFYWHKFIMIIESKNISQKVIWHRNEKVNTLETLLQDNLVLRDPLLPSCINLASLLYASVFSSVKQGKYLYLLHKVVVRIKWFELHKGLKTVLWT